MDDLVEEEARVIADVIAWLRSCSIVYHEEPSDWDYAISWIVDNLESGGWKNG